MSTGGTGIHASEQELIDYGRGVLADPAADVLDVHLIGCEQCRLALARVASDGEQARRDEGWTTIAAAVDVPTRWNRSSSWIRLAVGTPTLLFTALVLAAVFMAVPLLIAVGDQRAAVTWLLALGPVIPAIGTLIAYSTSADPAGALAPSTPLHSFRIVLIRTTVVLAALLPVGLLTTALLPGRTTLLLGWVLPALGLCAAVLAVGTRHDPRAVTAVLAALWAVAVAVNMGGLRSEPLSTALEDTAVNGPAIQVGALVVIGVATSFLMTRRHDVVHRSSW